MTDVGGTAASGQLATPRPTTSHPFFTIVAWLPYAPEALGLQVDNAVTAALGDKPRAFVLPRVAVVGLGTPDEAAALYGALEYIAGVQFPGSLSYSVAPGIYANQRWGGRMSDWAAVNAITNAVAIAEQESGGAGVAPPPPTQ